jgi:hypothetical protein
MCNGELEIVDCSLTEKISKDKDQITYKFVMKRWVVLVAVQCLLCRPPCALMCLWRVSSTLSFTSPLDTDPLQGRGSRGGAAGTRLIAGCAGSSASVDTVKTNIAIQLMCFWEVTIASVHIILYRAEAGSKILRNAETHWKKLHGVSSQKTLIFISAAIRSSKLRCYTTQWRHIWDWASVALCVNVRSHWGRSRQRSPYL